MKPRSIASINKLPPVEKEAIYRRFIPRSILTQFCIGSDLKDEEGRDLLTLKCKQGSTDAVADLRHESKARDPLLYVHLSDTINGQIHVLLYIINDPNSPRFDVDHLPDGTPTEFGIFRRNIDAEIAAMEAGLAPGQIRRGLRSMGESIETFESFITSLGHDLYFVEPLYYHNAILFERYGFAYQQGLHLMNALNHEFSSEGPLYVLLDGSSPFRMPGSSETIRGRSWALHDGIRGEVFHSVTMYKYVGRQSSINTFQPASGSSISHSL